MRTFDLDAFMQDIAQAADLNVIEAEGRILTFGTDEVSDGFKHAYCLFASFMETGLDQCRITLDELVFISEHISEIENFLSRDGTPDLSAIWTSLNRAKSVTRRVL